MKPLRIRPLAEHPDAMLLRLALDSPGAQRRRAGSIQVLASKQAVSLEGLIAKSEHALAAWRSVPPGDRLGRNDEAISTCLEQAIATLQALPVAPPIRRVGIPFEMRAAARAWREAKR